MERGGGEGEKERELGCVYVCMCACASVTIATAYGKYTADLMQCITTATVHSLLPLSIIQPLPVQVAMLLLQKENFIVVSH